MRCEHFIASSGELSARIILEGNIERLLHSAIKPEQERDWFRPEKILDVVFAFGTGLGYHLEFLNDLEPKRTIILCDAFPENLEIVQKKLNKQTVVLFSDNLKLKDVTVIRHPAAARYCENFNFNFTPSKSEYIAIPFGSHFLQQEILNALKELKLPVVTLPQENCVESSLITLFQKNTPRMVLCVNAKGIDSEGILLNVCKRFSVPVHIWFVDDPRPIACLFSKKQCENIFAWSWERAYIPWLKEKGFADAKYLPLAGDSNLFYPQNKKTIYDLMFIGSTMSGKFLDDIWKRVTYNKEEAFPIAESAAVQILTGAMTAEQLPGDTKDEAWFASYCIHLASAEKRRLCLLPLLDLGLKHVSEGIDYRNSLRSYYAQGNININITSCQMPSAVNQRVFDIPLCERFVISDNQSDLFELFPKDAIAAASSPEEYADLAKFYLKNEAAKNEIIKNAKEHVLSEHSYVKRIGEILKTGDFSIL